MGMTKVKYLVVWHINDGLCASIPNYKKADSWDETKQIINDVLHFPNVIYYAGPIWKTNAVLE